MARFAADDGRRMVVLYLADCDPAGWQMPVSLGRKLQALETLLFPGLAYEVHPICLTPEQVREYGLPSSPLKDTERRANKWRGAMGVEQTEIDALATLQPDLLDQLVRDAIAPFFDARLDRRVAQVRAEWRARAQDMLSDQLGPERLAEMCAKAEAQLAELEEQIAAVNDALRVDATGIRFPPIVVPRPVVAGADRLPLIDSDWSHAKQCRALRDRKAYS
jgi:hypothetical protein